MLGKIVEGDERCSGRGEIVRDVRGEVGIDCERC